MDGDGLLSDLNPNAPVFIPNPYPQLTLYPFFLTAHHYYLSHPTSSSFYFHSPHIQNFSWPTLYTDAYFQRTGFPPQLENMPVVVEATIPSLITPSKHSNKNHCVSRVDQGVTAQKVNLRKNGTPCYRDQGGAKCGNSKNVGCRSGENFNRKVYSLSTWSRSRARNEKRESSPVLPVHCGVGKTTIMIRNIPSKYTYDVHDVPSIHVHDVPSILYQYTRKMLVEFLDKHCKLENEKVKTEDQFVSAFNFVYLPIDFSTGCNKGFAFVNFTDPRAVWQFYLAANNRTWELFHSNKIRQIAFARLQGEELVRHFQSMGFPCESDEVLPLCFSPPRDGSRAFVKQSIVGRCIGMGPRGHRHERSR